MSPISPIPAEDHMRLFRNVVFSFVALTLTAGVAFAQDFDKEALKKKILKEVERRLKAQEKRLLEEIGKIIDEELSRTKPAPAKAEKKPMEKATAEKKREPAKKTAATKKAPAKKKPAPKAKAKAKAKVRKVA